jgi:FeoB-associated Cys-rich membrane protein
MTWQLPLVLLLVAAAAGYLAWRAWRTWFGSKARGCGGGCGCAAKPAAAKNGHVTLVPVEQLTLRRKDESHP